MTSRDFCYWLQGYIELASADGTPVVTKEKVECIQKHLAMVFKTEIDPSFKPSIQSALNDIHKPQIGGEGPGGTLYRC